MNDPRIVLRDGLIKIGLSSHVSTLIALEAGSSQACVDYEYLKEIGLHEAIINEVLKLVCKFYSGSLSGKIN